MPPLYRMLEVCVYSLTNFLPFLAMALYPFRRRLRFSPAVAAALVAVLTLLQMGLACALPSSRRGGAAFSAPSARGCTPCSTFWRCGPIPARRCLPC